MKREQFEVFVKELEGRGYRKQNFGAFGHEDYSYYKCLVREEDEYGELRSKCIVFFKVYDYFLMAERTHRDNLPKEIYITPHIMVLREIGEREEYETMHDILNVDHIESLARKFYEFVNANVPLTSHEEQKE